MGGEVIRRTDRSKKNLSEGSLDVSMKITFGQRNRREFMKKYFRDDHKGVSTNRPMYCRNS